MRPVKKNAQEEKNAGGGPRTIDSDKPASYGFIGSAGDIIFSTEPDFKDNYRSFLVEAFGIVWALGGLWDGRV